MKEQPIEVLISSVKQQLVILINNCGLPPSIIDAILCSVLAEVRNQETLELFNYIKKLESEQKKKEGEE